MTNKKHKTLVMSDIHVGSRWSRTNAATSFLKRNSCQTLILCGDIIDSWAIGRSSEKKWFQAQTNFVRALMDCVSDTEIIYIKGNHDEFVERITKLGYKSVTFAKEYIYQSNGKSYLVTHGDIFDPVTTSHRWLAKLGDIGYSALLHINRRYNIYRLRKGLPYRSIARDVKKRVKNSISKFTDFDQQVAQAAAAAGCQGVICGHIHQADIKMIGDIQYLNSGDWMESLTALTEDWDGNWTMHKQG